MSALEDGDEKLDQIKDQLDEIERNQMELSKALVKKKKSWFSYGKDENKSRGNWTTRPEFLLSSVGYTLGILNVWRFPYLCYKNGGAAFIIPYLVFLFLMGIPVLLCEISLAQFCSEGILTMWRFSPLFTGVGYGMFLVALMVCIYYGVVNAWAFYYLFSSFRKDLPWAMCGNWSSELCMKRLHNVTYAQCLADPTLTPNPNGVCYNQSTIYGVYNETLAAANGMVAKFGAYDFASRVGLMTASSPGLHNIGRMRWEICLCLLLVWILVYLFLIRGVKSLGKFAYLTTLFPYILLIVLLIYGLFQPGYMDGVNKFVMPNFARLGDISVWKDAGVQVFLSLGLCWGGLATLASYNRFRTSVVRDATIISLINVTTSILIGFVFFIYAGAFAKQRGVPVDKILNNGIELVFISFPQTLTVLSAPTLWTIFYFIAIILMGLGTQMVLVETIVTGVADLCSHIRRYKILVLTIFSIFAFLMGLVMTTAGGPYIVILMDDYCRGWNVMFLALMMCVAIAVYSDRTFARDIETMCGKMIIGCLPWRCWQWKYIICWIFISPILILFTMVYTWVKYHSSKYQSYTFPGWANAIGWILACLVVLAVIFTMILQILITPGGILQRLKRVTTPAIRWGPALPKHRRLVTYVEGFVVQPDLPEDLKYKTYNGRDNEVYDNPALEIEHRTSL